MGKSKKKKSTALSVSEVTIFLLQAATTMFTFILLFAIPLFFRNRYADIGYVKNDVFHFLSTSLLAACLPVLGVYLFYDIRRNKEKYSVQYIISQLSVIDWFALAYLAVCILSFLFSPYHTWKFFCDIEDNPAWYGSRGWEMGLKSQILFVTDYFLVSRFFSKKWIKDLLWSSLVAGFIAFVLAVLHRFQVDPLDMYRGADYFTRRDFLSTIGQATHYSSYLCIALPVGLYLYWFLQKGWRRNLLLVYCATGFMSLVTQNSDSAFLAMAGFMLVLFFASFRTEEAFIRFWECVIVALASFSVVGVFYQVFQNRVTQLDPFSVGMMTNPVIYILLVLSVVIYAVCSSLNKKNRFHIEKIKWVKPIIILLIPAAIVTATGLICYTTAQVNQGNTTPLSNVGYFVFNDYWGNHRGFSWKLTFKLFARFHILQMLIGIGSDCVANFGLETMGEYIKGYYEGKILGCVHNEWLNMLLTNGVLGFISYTGFFVTAIVTFYKNRKEQIWCLIGAGCIVAYMCHNFFCYQQAVCTSVMVVVMGAVELLRRKE